MEIGCQSTLKQSHSNIFWTFLTVGETLLLKMRNKIKYNHRDHINQHLNFN